MANFRLTLNLFSSILNDYTRVKANATRLYDPNAQNGCQRLGSM